MLARILWMDEKQISGLPCILILAFIIRKRIFATTEGRTILFHNKFNPNDVTIAAINQLSITSCSIQYRQPTHKHHVCRCWDSKIWQPDDAAEAHDMAEELVLNVLWAILVAMTKLKSRINSFCNCHEMLREHQKQHLTACTPPTTGGNWADGMSCMARNEGNSISPVYKGRRNWRHDSLPRRWTYVDEMPLCNSEMDVHNLWELDWILYGNMRNTYIH